MLRLPRLCFPAALLAVRLLAADAPADPRDTVVVASVKTGIYVGTVTMTSTPFHREGDRYVATYEAKVWPWFFWSEHGKLAISLPRADLERLDRGERVEFTGEAFNHKNKPRHVRGHADRTDATTGKIKVRIGVDDTELVFNSTYRFGDDARK